MGLNQLLIRPWSFVAGFGFKAPDHASDVTVKMVNHRPFKQDFLHGEMIMCMGKAGSRDQMWYACRKIHTWFLVLS